MNSVSRTLLTHIKSSSGFIYFSLLSSQTDYLSHMNNCCLYSVVRDHDDDDDDDDEDGRNCLTIDIIYANQTQGGKFKKMKRHPLQETLQERMKELEAS